MTIGAIQVRFLSLLMYRSVVSVVGVELPTLRHIARVSSSSVKHLAHPLREYNLALSECCFGFVSDPRAK